MELGVPMETIKLIDKVENNEIAIRRLQTCINNGEKFVILIESIRLYKKHISIKRIKEIEPTFFVPQCYLNIKNHEKLYKYLNEQELYPEEFFHNHGGLYIDNIGCSCREMEIMDEFKEKDKEYTKNSKYEIIK